MVGESSAGFKAKNITLPETVSLDQNDVQANQHANPAELELYADSNVGYLHADVPRFSECNSWQAPEQI